MYVLVVEDEPRIAAFIQKGLREESYAVDVASDGEAGVVCNYSSVRGQGAMQHEYQSDNSRG
ncbi:MAG: hypothetical protein ABIO92_04215 [Chloroflexia bacterium]